MGGEAGSDAGERKGTLGRVWFWVSQTVSVIGLISIVDDLQLWLDMARWAIGKLDGILPALADFVVAIGNVIHPALELFRGFFRPIIDFLLQWLPFAVPELAKDVIVVAVFIALGHFRTRIRYDQEWRRANEADKGELLALAQQAGIILERRQIGDLRQALSAYRSIGLDRIIGFAPTSPSLQQHYARERERWNAALEQFGPGLEEFAASYAKSHGWGTARTSAVFRNEHRAMLFVWSLGLLTGLLVVVDLYFVQ